MATNTRMYVVSVKGVESLVEASNPSQAIRAVVQAGVTCAAASSKDVARLMKAGKPLIDASVEPEHDPEAPPNTAAVVF